VSGQLLAQVERAGAIETKHYGIWGHLKSSKLTSNDLTERICLRSTAKLFQTLACLRIGLPLNQLQIAVGSSSHSGSPLHVKAVQNLLEAFNLESKYLKCGEHPPIDRSISQANPKTPERILQNNCSGKHAMMLATCKLNNWELQAYTGPQHPLQQVILNTIAELCEVPISEISLGLDGCGLPTYSLRLKDFLKGFAKFQIDSPDEQIANITKSFLANSIYVSGPNRLDHELTQAAAGKLICKSGAGGLTAVALPQGSLVVKIYDSDEKIRALCLKKLLEKFGIKLISEHPLFTNTLLNLHKEVTAQIIWNEAAFDI
jgi:L-asparaginase II